MGTPDLIKGSHRILIIDDNRRIHDDFRKILCPLAESREMSDYESALFGESAETKPLLDFEIDSAYQGREGLEMVEKALAEDRPYSMAFVDVRMPPGWDGIETIRRIWKCHTDLQVVICTAFSDHSWEDILAKLGNSDSLLILKKPFDNVEVLQMAHAFTKKWLLTRQAKSRMGDLENMVESRTAELSKANEQLRAEVTRRADIENALRYSEERFHRSFEAALVALAILDEKTLEHTDMNGSYLSLIGRDSEEALGKTPCQLQMLENPAAFTEAISTMKAGRQIHNLDLQIRRADRKARQALLSIVPLVLGGKPSLLVTLLDVTDQRHLESQLRQSQKMEAIGQLAAGVAHDFNNLLTVIIGHASIQLKKASLDHEVAKSLEQVKLAGERASGLTRQLLAFSRKQVLRRSPVDVGNTIRLMQKMLSRLVGETVQFEVLCGENVPCVLADESSIEQVLLNLVVNARDAMEHGGNLTIELGAIELSEADAGRSAEARAGRFVVLTVTDTGCGMDEKTQRRLFEPFFTTKAVGKGTGLGLSMIYGIVKQHEGWIEVESQLHSGTVFRMFLPATMETVKSADASLVAKPPAARNECILVVEDEPLVRSYVCQALRAHGFRVMEADCGQSALDVWQASGGKIDLLLTDMVMPNGMSGGELAKSLRRIRKYLKVVFMSGYSPELVENDNLLDGASNFLPKPFSQGRLIDVVTLALDHNGKMRQAEKQPGPAALSSN
jgi:PAS domain S-box-containing protein